jgi:hypothetical protein
MDEKTRKQLAAFIGETKVEFLVEEIEKLKPMSIKERQKYLDAKMNTRDQK